MGSVYMRLLLAARFSAVELGIFRMRDTFLLLFKRNLRSGICNKGYPYMWNHKWGIFLITKPDFSYRRTRHSGES